VYYVYILKSKRTNKFHYVGLTSNLTNRFSEHQEGKTAVTKGYRPLTLAWYCVFGNKNQAAQFEKYLKSGSGRSFAKRHLL